jgi:hypothetical protein
VAVPKGPWDVDAYLGVWLFTANDEFYPAGGSAQVEGGEPVGAVSNSRLGATLSLPVGTRQWFKISYSAGVVDPHRDRFPDPRDRLSVALVSLVKTARIAHALDPTRA